MSYFIQQIVYGLSAGSIYALIALGYTMVYGIVVLINFAHGEVLMMGAYFTFFGIVEYNIPIMLALPISMVLCAILGVLIDRIAYGFVVDFIDWHINYGYHWATFNVADAVIVVAMGLLIIEMIRQMIQERKA
jgi:branched-subunit amino acid ABC-type transport system permease component